MGPGGFAEDELVEALVAFLTLPNRVLVWLVRPDRTLVFHDVPLPRHGDVEPRRRLAQLVDRVRTSLDQSDNDGWSGRLLPFDIAGAHELYRLLFAPLGAQLVGVDHLIVVPGEVLLPLPFSALVTTMNGEPHAMLADLHARRAPLDAAELREYGRVAWLARAHAVTVLPSATSLRALRGASSSWQTGREPLIAFGDPVFDGTGRDRGGSMPDARDINVALATIRALNRLPGTRAELQAIAQALGADPARALFMDARATKPDLLALNRSGRLGDARVLAFATHGLLAGELAGLAQPALALTPPAVPSVEDNGLLRLEDVLGLRLAGTEWTVLSACRTAAADGSGEGLSGLARGFLFAGARALLVSHWAVDDDATRALMTLVFERYARDAHASRAEALRQAMLSLMARGGATGRPDYAHPFAWAPFFLVGEGALERPGGTEPAP